MDERQVEELRKLKTLLNEGVITKDEFDETRELILTSRVEDSDNAPSNDDVVKVQEEVHTSNQLSNTKSSAIKRYGIIIGMCIVLIIIALIAFFRSANKIEDARKAIVGKWDYDYSTMEDENDTYKAIFLSAFDFKDDGTVKIRVDNCSCEGTWDIKKNKDYYFIYITPINIKGQSENLDHIIETLTYEEHNNRQVIYWFDWDGEQAKHWHYYRPL